DGKSKNYLALALYHTPLQSSKEPRVEFWDLIAGRGGVLTEIFYEQRPPLESSLESTSSASECAPCTRKTTGQDSEFYPRVNQANHKTGNHTTNTRFRGECEYYDNCSMGCNVKIKNMTVTEQGEVTGPYLTEHFHYEDEKYNNGGSNTPSKLECAAGI